MESKRDCLSSSELLLNVEHPSLESQFMIVVSLVPIVGRLQAGEIAVWQ